MSCTEKACDYAATEVGLIEHIGKTFMVTQTIKFGSSSYKFTQPVNLVYTYTNFETTLQNLTIEPGVAKTFNMPKLTEGSSPYKSHTLSGNGEKNLAYDPVKNTL